MSSPMGPLKGNIVRKLDLYPTKKNKKNLAGVKKSQRQKTLSLGRQRKGIDGEVAGNGTQ